MKCPYHGINCGQNLDTGPQALVSSSGNVSNETMAQELQAKTVFIESYLFESGATLAQALEAWEAQKKA